MSSIAHEREQEIHISRPLVDLVDDQVCQCQGREPLVDKHRGRHENDAAVFLAKQLRRWGTQTEKQMRQLLDVPGVQAAVTNGAMQRTLLEQESLAREGQPEAATAESDDHVLSQIVQSGHHLVSLNQLPLFPSHPTVT